VPTTDIPKLTLRAASTVLRYAKYLPEAVQQLGFVAEPFFLRSSDAARTLTVTSSVATAVWLTLVMFELICSGLTSW
jgi:hypothetical protein